MIKDIIDNSGFYKSLSENLKNGFEWIKTNDLDDLPDGKYVINGDKLFANIQTYTTKDNADFEAHREYVDIQYMISGKEICEICKYSDCSTIEAYNREKDIEFLKEKSAPDKCILNTGDFLVLFPWDAHKPALKCEQNETVKKVVVKVKI